MLQDAKGAMHPAVYNVIKNSAVRKYRPTELVVGTLSSSYASRMRYRFTWTNRARVALCKLFESLN
jgi:hypothetical protein